VNYVAQQTKAAAPARHCWSRVPFLTKWINHLCEDDPGAHKSQDEISRSILRIGDSADVSRSKRIVSGWTPMEESNFFEDLKTGIVLCKVVERP